MNPLSDNLITGTAGELIVQLRLFQYGVQAAPPLKDSGNDLIAVRGSTFKAIQVKTTSVQSTKPQIPVKREYHIMAWVKLQGENKEYYLDYTEIYLLERTLIDAGLIDWENLEEYRISQKIVDRLIPVGD